MADNKMYHHKKHRLSFRRDIIRILIVSCLVLITGCQQTPTKETIKPVIDTEKFTVTLAKCIDGDTARFIVDGKEEKVRFLAIDTPEITGDTPEPYGEEASDYTCSVLKQATKIVLELDPNSDIRDKYDRLLAWIWVDGELLNQQLIKRGYAEIAFLYGDYLYIKELDDTESIAEISKIGIWSQK